MASSFCLANSFSIRVATLFAVSYYYLGYSLHKRRVLRFGLVSLSLVAEKLLRAQPMLSFIVLMCQSARFFRVAKRLGLLLWWAIVSELCSKEFAVHLFYIPSPSDVGIVFLLGLTTSNCLLILSPLVEELLPCRRAFRSRDCLVIIYGSITS